MADLSSPAARRLTLAGACAGGFTERTRRKGREHVEQGQAAIEGATEETVLCFVRGERSKPFLTALDFAEVETRERVRVECSCPYFRDGYPCEHIFAGLLAVDASGLDLVPASALMGRLDVVPYKAGLPGDDDWFFEGENAFANRQKVAEAFFEAQGRPREPDWRGQLLSLKRSLLVTGPSIDQLMARQPFERLQFRVHREKSEDRGTLVVETFRRVADPEYPTGKLEPLFLTRKELDLVTRDEERRAVELLMATPLSAGLIRPSEPGIGPLASNASLVPAPLWDVVLPALAATGAFRCPIDPQGRRTTPPIELDDGPPYRFRAVITGEEDRRLTAVLSRNDEQRSVHDAHLVIRDGLVLFGTSLSRLETADDFDWLKYIRRQGDLQFPASKTQDFLKSLTEIGNLPPLDIELEGLRVSTPKPRCSVLFARPDPKSRFVFGDVVFDYQGQRFHMTDERSATFDGETFTARDPVAEQREIERLGGLGLKRDESAESHQVVVKPSELNGAVRRLAEAGFLVRAEGRPIRSMTGQSFRIESGVDWFDVAGEVEFEGQRVSLPELLRAVREREGLVKLDDGSEGLLPEAWLHRLGALGRLGGKKGNKLRFTSGQAMMLDALLEASEVDLEVDAAFRAAQASLQEVRQVQPADEPPGFSGSLRTYQKEGLGWLAWLDQLGFGGCLADDMGLGKTIQVLALLQSRNNRFDPQESGEARSDSPRHPSLLVAPRSLVYNWLREAERFTPGLRVLDYTGSRRTESLGELSQVDLMVTTYGTVRRDIDVLRQQIFDFVILDEAQAIKNPSAQASKACRLLRGRRRLALSGTPVENDASELWSIFEFLNPKMLGSRREFQALSRAEGTLPIVARGLKPLLLRRTKSQVLSELPEKTELTIHCELSSAERQAYDELRDHYRSSIQERVEQEGLNRSRMHVLEALLRLRQAACHPGLIDPNRTKESSSKMDALLEHVNEVLSEGHKALIFSQFVKLLDIVRYQMDEAKLPYAYLDGQTTDRAGQVERFMEDDDVKLFLISLKAGGLGLNLTAADYVFILDPWWNPAVEAQAIDRAHRIGQTRPVFAYRFVARETVEEKIIQLHQHKRQLADALVSADENFVKELTFDDLRLLLGS
ncbi:MAG: SNF2-related protein [Myxococcota bacterium]